MFLPSCSDRELFSDFHLLEDTKRIADNARRHEPPQPRAELPAALATLRYQAQRRGVELLIQGPGMEKRQTNTTW